MDNKSSKLSLLFLPEEIIHEILSRLAVKSLLRFRCVSKLWRSLIGSEQFIKTHLQNSSKNTALAHHRLILTFYSKRQRHSLINLGNIQTFFSSKIIGCCNGLVCIVWQNCILLWNPAIRIFKELPQIKLEIEGTPSYLVNYGFGWDESSGAYKVFVVSLNRKEHICRVYSSKSNSWKSVESWDFDFISGKAQFASGNLHWFKMKKNGGMDIVSNIVTFDLKSEELGKMEMPCPCDSTARLGVLEGRLCVVSYDKRKHLDVWVMKEDSWVKMMEVLVYEPCHRFSLVKQVLRGLNIEILPLRGSVFSVHNHNLVEEDALSLLKELKRAIEENIYIESLVSPV